MRRKEIEEVVVGDGGGKFGRNFGGSSPATRCRRWLAGVGAGEGRSSLGGGEEVKKGDGKRKERKGNEIEKEKEVMMGM